MRRTLSFVMAVCALLALDAGAKVKIINASPSMMKASPAAPAADAARGEKWVATKAILRDGKTGELRKPTEAETRELVSTLRSLTSRSAAAPRRVISADGHTQSLAETGIPQIVLVRATAEGQNETLCVQTFEEAVAFLGLERAAGDK